MEGEEGQKGRHCLVDKSDWEQQPTDVGEFCTGEMLGQQTFFTAVGDDQNADVSTYKETAVFP